MALARCDTCGRPKGKKGNSYMTRSYLPVGHPNSGIICGTKGCENGAVIWLLESEATAYAKGQRVFELPTRAAKIKTQDSD